MQLKVVSGFEQAAEVQIYVDRGPSSTTVAWDLPAAWSFTPRDYIVARVRQILASEAHEHTSARRLIDLLRGQPAGPGTEAVPSADPVAVITARTILASFPDQP